MITIAVAMVAWRGDYNDPSTCFHYAVQMSSFRTSAETWHLHPRDETSRCFLQHPRWSSKTSYPQSSWKTWRGVGGVNVHLRDQPTVGGHSTLFLLRTMASDSVMEVNTEGTNPPAAGTWRQSKKPKTTFACLACRKRGNWFYQPGSPGSECITTV